MNPFISPALRPRQGHFQQRRRRSDVIGPTELADVIAELRLAMARHLARADAELRNETPKSEGSAR